MRRDTIQHLCVKYSQPQAMFAGQCADSDELNMVAVQLGVPLSEDYREFVARFGGGHAGSLPVAGLRRWEAAADLEWNVVELTKWFRSDRWPGTELWVVFSNDGFGNPIGLDADGRVWVSDHDCRECVCLEATFEDWLRRWALRMEPHRKGYLAQLPWGQRVE